MMTVDSRIPVTISLVAAVVIATVGVLTTWWPLIWCALLLALAGGSLVLWRRGGTDREAASLSGTTWTAEAPEPDLVRHDTPQESPAPRRTHLSKVALPSAHEEYDVLLSAVVCWSPDRDTAPGTDGHAKSLVLERAAELTRHDPPEEFELTRHRLAADLGQALRSGPEGIEVWADEVRLELRDEDAARLQRIRDFRKDEEIRGYERAAERSLRDYLRSDMLADPGQAVLWWLARDPECIHETVHEIGTLSRLSAAANGTDIPDLYRALAAGEHGSNLHPPQWPTSMEAETGPPDENQPPLFSENSHDGESTTDTELDHGVEESLGRHDGTAASARAFLDLLAEPNSGDKREVYLDIVVRMLTDAGREDVVRHLESDLDATSKESTKRRTGGDSPNPDGGENASSQNEPDIGATRTWFFQGDDTPEHDSDPTDEAKGRETVDGTRARENGEHWGNTSPTADPHNWSTPADWEVDADGDVSRPHGSDPAALANAEPGHWEHRDAVPDDPGSAETHNGEAGSDRL